MTTLRAETALIPERIDAGDAWLTERFGPSWIDRINLDTLNLARYDLCIFGQVHSGSAELNQEGVRTWLKGRSSVWESYGFLVPHLMVVPWLLPMRLERSREMTRCYYDRLTNAWSAHITAARYAAWASSRSSANAA